MANVVTFDPVNLLILENTVGGDNELQWQEIYSEWKDWLLADLSRLGYPQAFRYAGADPISSTRSLGTTYFLMNGWRFRPAELNHRLTLVGNCFTDPAGFSVVVPTLGSFTVAVEYSTSNLIDTIATGGSTGPTAAELADAVWDEPGHNNPGTMAAVLQALVNGLTPSQATQLSELWNLSGLDPAGPLITTAVSRMAPNIAQQVIRVPGMVTVKRV